MIEWLFAAGGMLFTYLAGRAHQNGVQNDVGDNGECVFEGQNWKIYVTSVEDSMTQYKGIYMRDGRTVHSATGHGVSETLVNLADKIGKP